MADNKLTVVIDGKDNLTGQLRSIESGLIRFVGAVSSALATISTIAFPVAASASFQRELLEAVKTTDYARDQTLKLKDGLVELSRQIDVSANDLAKIATMGGQLGIGQGGNVSGLLSFTEEIARAVTALDIPADEAATSFGKLINIFDIPADEFRNAISALNAVSNASNATADQLFDVTRRIGNLGGSVDLSQSIALSAAMVDLGLTAETAGTTVTKIFADMKSKAGEFASFVGVSTEKWVETITKDGLAALKLFVDRLNALPAAEAALAKVTLTGGGRIFEAVSKLQEQQRRADELNNRALALEQRIAAEKAAGLLISKEDEDIARKRIENLRKQAINVNVVTRLVGVANDGYTSGISAIKEQQVVLGGLSRQWDVFANRVKSLGFAAGDGLLTPLTLTLKEFGEALDTAVNRSEVAQGAENIVEAFRTIRNAIADYTGDMQGLEGAGNLTNLINATALITAAAALKGLTFLITLLGAKLYAAAPGSQALTNYLLGVVPAAEGAANGLNQAGAAAARTGGIFQRAGAAIVAGARNMNAIDAQYAKLSQAQAVLAQRTGVLAAKQTQLAAVFSKVRANLRSEAALRTEIIALLGREQAQLLANETRAAAATRGRIIRLKNLLAQAEATQAGINGLNAAIARTEGYIGRTQARITALSTGAAGAFRTAVNGAVSFGAAIRRAALAATQLEIAVSSALAQGNFRGAAATLGQGIVRGLNATGVTAAFARMRASFAGLVTGVRTGSINMNTALSSVGRVGVAAFAAVDRGVRRVSASIRVLAIQAAGLGAEWALATSTMARGFIVASAAATLFGRAVRGLVGLASRLMGAFFFVLIAVELIKFTGLWEHLRKAIVEVGEALGYAESEMPDWLQSAAAIDETAKATERLAEATRGQAEQSAKMNAEIAANIEALKNRSDAARQVTFDPNDPAAASKNFNEAIGDATTAQSNYQTQLRNEEVLQEKLKAAVEAREKALKNLTDAQEEANKARPVGNRASGLGVDTQVTTAEIRRLEKDAKAAAAAVTEIDRQLADVATRKEQTEGAGVALANVATEAFSASEATALFARSTEDGLSALERYTKLLDEQAAAGIEVERLQENLANYNTTDQTGDSAVAYQQLNDNLATATERMSALQKQAEGMRAKLVQSGRSTTEFDKFLKTLEEQRDKGTVTQFASQLAELYKIAGAGAFQGKLLPKIEADDILEASLVAVVADRQREIYATKARLAEAEAKRAENAASNALSDMERMAKSTQAVIEKLDQSVAKAGQSAKNQLADRLDDAASRRRLNQIDSDEQVETALLQKRLDLTKSLNDERSKDALTIGRQVEESLRLENQLTFELGEKYDKLRQAEQDRLDLKKAQRAASDESALFDRVIKQVEHYKKIAEEANAIILNDAAPAGERQGAIERKTDAINRMRAGYSQAVEVAERLANTEAIGGKLVVDPNLISRMSGQIKQVSEEIGQVNVTGADKVAQVWTNAAASFATESAKFGQIAELNIAKVREFAGNTGFEKAAADMSRLIGSSAEFRAELEKINQLGREGLFSASSIDPESFRKLGKEVVDNVLPTLRNTEIPLNLTVDEGNVALQVASALTNSNIPASVTASLREGTKEDLSRALEQADIEVPVTAKVKKMVGQNGEILFQQFAGGGSVWGAGTSTSDSIPAWLSNGEYVMDAHTTGTFGHGFFAMLQRLARSGGGLDLVRGLKNGLPRFATGGPVLGDVAGLASQFATGFNTGSKDYLEILLKSGDEGSTIYAERRHADALVSILDKLNRG